MRSSSLSTQATTTLTSLAMLLLIILNNNNHICYVYRQVVSNGPHQIAYLVSIGMFKLRTIYLVVGFVNLFLPPHKFRLLGAGGQCGKSLNIELMRKFTSLNFRKKYLICVRNCTIVGVECIHIFYLAQWSKFVNDFLLFQI